ncbi:MAG: PAS domain S-box protein [Gemmatimonadales bacterium]|nr:MAG: PAS domain S-box protein [Gemmatimonadales bacterium]
MTSRAGVGGDAGASPDGSASELRALLESTDDAIWSVDREGRAVQFNTACQRLLESVTGRRPQIGDTPEDLMSPAAAQWFRECYERALRGARFTVVREENVGGRPVVWELCFNPVEGDSSAHGGDYQGVVVFTRDVTRQRMVEKALLRAKNEAEAANRAKSHFLAQMSHELRTPLNSIIGFSRLLRKKGVELLPERELGFLGRIEANGHHLLQLINEILDLSKVESGHLEP